MVPVISRLGEGTHNFVGMAQNLVPELATKIAVEGMRLGIFTDQKLDTHFNDKNIDYQGARSIVNGQDKAEEIAERAEVYAKILSQDNLWKNVFHCG